MTEHVTDRWQDLLRNECRQHPVRVVLVALWAVLQSVPLAFQGTLVAHSMDDGFLAGRPALGMLWLAGVLAGALLTALATSKLVAALGAVVEPFRDGLVRKVTAGELTRALHTPGRTDSATAARLTTQVDIVHDSIGGLLSTTVALVTGVVAVVVGLVSLGWALAASIVAPVFLALILFFPLLPTFATRHRAALACDEKLAESVTSVVAASRDATACGLEDHAVEQITAHAGQRHRSERSLAQGAAVRAALVATGGYLPLLLLIVLAPRLRAGGTSIGALIGASTYVISNIIPLFRTFTTTMSSTGLRVAAALARISAATPAVPSAPQRQHCPEGTDIVLAGVTFSYSPQATPVLRSLDLALPQGSHLAVVGPSGIGKSTLTDLVTGVLTPDRGAVLVGGVPVPDLPPEDLARIFAVIPQQAYVFAGTLEENLTYLRPDASRQDMDQAAERMGLTPLVHRLGGYTASVSPRSLSTGEQQLITLTRVYLSQAPVVVLDEATSGLDPVAEARVEEAFAARGGTLIVIAHRMSSALRAPTVLVLDAEHALAGTHDQLLQRSTTYADLMGHWRERHDNAAVQT
ncbi:ATP-binding cassette domain-containing protein [Streptomyces sp. NPDC002521]